MLPQISLPNKSPSPAPTVTAGFSSGAKKGKENTFWEYLATRETIPREQKSSRHRREQSRQRSAAMLTCITNNWAARLCWLCRLCWQKCLVHPQNKSERKKKPFHGVGVYRQSEEWEAVSHVMLDSVGQEYAPSLRSHGNAPSNWEEVGAHWSQTAGDQERRDKTSLSVIISKRKKKKKLPTQACNKWRKWLEKWFVLIWMHHRRRSSRLTTNGS